MEPVSGTGEPQAPSPASPATPDLKKWVIPAVIVLGVVAIAMILLPVLFGSPPGGTVQPIQNITGTTPVPTGFETLTTTGIPVAGSTPGATETSPETEGTTVPIETAAPCIPAGEPGFTVTVSPVETTAARGAVVNYSMAIESQNCFSENVSMKLTASVLFLFSNTYDLGTQTPPYPKTFEYPLTVPDSLFPGATVNGVLTSTGGGITREDHLTLHVT